MDEDNHGKPVVRSARLHLRVDDGWMMGGHGVVSNHPNTLSHSLMSCFKASKCLKILWEIGKNAFSG